MVEGLKLENVLESKLDVKAGRFGANREALRVLMAALRAEEDQIRQGGGPKAAEAQRAKGRLTVGCRAQRSAQRTTGRVCGQTACSAFQSGECERPRMPHDSIRIGSGWV